MVTTEGARNRGVDEARIFLERLDQIAKRGAKDDRFRIVSEIAQGGMGRVLRVYDEDLRRELAMKVIRLGSMEPGASSTGTTGRENLALFLEEVQITGQLNHPSVVPVHDVGVNARGELYYLMPLLRGIDLKAGIERLRGGAVGWTLPRVIEVICRAAQAVEHAHQSGVVHRDLKPANVMIGDLGEIWVLDWGLAQLERRPFDEGASGVDSETHLLLRTGGLVGTPGYMAPEQVEGLAGTIGPRSDVYALGAVLYHVLTGEMPYASPPQSCAADTFVQRTLAGPPKRVHELSPNAPPELVAICEKAMQREPTQRYASALAMANDLRAWLEGRVVSTYDVGALGAFRKWRRRNRAAARSLDALGFVAVLGSLAFAVQQRRHVIAVEHANEEQRRANHAANVRAADLSIQGHDAKEAKRLLTICPREMQGWEWRWLDAQVDASVAVLEAPNLKLVGLSLDGAGHRAAAWDESGAVWLWDLPRRSGRAIELRNSAAARRRTSAAISPDGRTLAILAGGGRVELIEVDTPGALRAFDASAAELSALAWSPDGRLLACGTVPGGVAIVDVEQLEPVCEPLPGTDTEMLGARSLCFAPDGASVTVCGDTLPPLLWRWRHAGQSEPIKLGSSVAYSASYAPDGSRVVLAGKTGRIGLYAASDGTRLDEFESGTAEVRGVAFTRDGRGIVAACGDGSLRLWNPCDGAPSSVLLGHTSTAHAISRAGGEDEFVSCSADGSLRIWRPLEHSHGLERRAAPELVALAWSGAEQQLYGVSFDGRIVALAPEGPKMRGAAHASQARLHATIDGTNGHALLGDVEGSIELRRLADGGVEHSVRVLDGQISAVALDPGGVCIGVGGDSGALVVLERASGLPLLRDEASTTRITKLAFAPTRRGAPPLAVARSKNGISIVEPFEGGNSRSLGLEEEECSALAWSGDGAKLAAGALGGKIFILDPTGMEPPFELIGHGKSVRALCLAADGSRLFSISRDRMLRIWDPRNKSPLLTLVDLEIAPESLAVDARGERIACATYVQGNEDAPPVLVLSAHARQVNARATNE